MPEKTPIVQKNDTVETKKDIDVSLEVGKAISSIQNKNTAELFNTVLLGDLTKLVKQKNTAKIESLLYQYKDYTTEAVIKKLSADLDKLMNIPTDISDEKVPFVPKTKSPQQEEKMGTIQDLGIKIGTILYNEKDEPIMVKKINNGPRTIDVVDEQGKYLTGCKITSSEEGHITVIYGKKEIGLWLSVPAHATHEGIDLEHSHGIISIDVGQTFLDGKNTPWKIGKIDEHNGSVVVEVENAFGEHERVYIRDWENKNNSEVLRTLGDRMTLIRSVSGVMDPESANLVDQSPERYTISSLTLTTGDAAFKLERGQSYTDINNEKWTVTGILSLPKEQKYKIAIKSENGEQDAIVLKEWDSYTDSVLMTDEEGDSYMFTPIEQEAPAIEETPIEETEEIPETPTVEIPETNLGVEDVAELNAAAKEEAEGDQQRNLPAIPETPAEQTKKEVTENSSEPETPKEQVEEKEEVKETIEESNEPEEQKERKLEEIEKELEELQKKIARRNKIFEHFERVVK